jgi:hypothetical protein
MKPYHQLTLSVLTALALLAGIPAQADNMASIAITPATGVVTLAPRWSIGPSLGGFHHMAQDLSLGGEANDFYSLKSTAIPMGGDIAAFTLYVAGSGAATNHADIGSKLTPNYYSALTSADPDIGYGSVNMYFIHHKSTGDYFSVLVPGSAVSSSVTDLKPMDGPGGPATLGASGYFGLTFASANLGYGLNYFYYLRTDPVTGYTIFGTLDPALLGTSADQFDLGISGYNALSFTGTDVGYGTDKMYYLRLEPITGFTVLGTLHPLTGQTSDIANLGSVFTTLTFIPGDVGFGSGQFYTTGAVNPTWQSVSFAAIADRAVIDGSFTVNPTASSGLPIVLTVVSGSATISAPVGGVFTVTPTAPGLITLQATQVGAINPTPYEYNMLRQSFMVYGSFAGTPDFDGDGLADVLWRNSVSGVIATWTTSTGYQTFGNESVMSWRAISAADFDGDGLAEVLWRNTASGIIATWTTNTGYQTFGNESVMSWRAISAADFDSDGFAEVLWRNTASGVVATWTTSTGYQSFGSESGNSWRAISAADFDGDGFAEVLWRNTASGVIASWTSTTGYQSFGSESGISWRAISAGDYDGDGLAEVLWRNTASGLIASWTTSTGYESFGSESGTNWRAVAQGD